jgi:hypothetical protein
MMSYIRSRGSIPGRSQRLLSRPALGPTQHPIRWVSGALSSRIKLPRREADHLSPSSTDVKNDGDTPPLPHISSWPSA